MQAEISFDGYGTPPHKLVRRDDPGTSYDAAVAVDTSHLEKLVYETIKRFGDTGCISDDVRHILHWLPYSSVTARYKSLEEKKRIEYTGEKSKGESGRQQRIMRAL